MSLTLDPHEQLDIAVGNRLRIANNRFDLALHRLRPFSQFDWLMDDLCKATGTDWQGRVGQAAVRQA